VFEEYYPLDQPEYSSTISKVRDGKVDCVFSTVIPPGVQPFMKQLYESGFQRNGGVIACLYYDENSLNFNPPHELDGLISCLDFFHTVDDPFSRELLAAYNKKFRTRSTSSPPAAPRPACTAASASTKPPPAANGDLSREAVSAALDKAKLAQGPGGGAEMVPGKMHCR
jgi:branched-chain amino acid transport system substrate-binding protein